MFAPAEANGAAGGASRLIVIYDGECPFCSRYATLVRLRERGLSVELRDARKAETFALFPRAREYDLDRGMLVGWNGSWHFGAAAMQTISELSGTAPLAVVMRNHRLSRLVYPALRLGRALTLRVMGRSRI